MNTAESGLQFGSMTVGSWPGEKSIGCDCCSNQTRGSTVIVRVPPAVNARCVGIWTMRTLQRGLFPGWEGSELPFERLTALTVTTAPNETALPFASVAVPASWTMGVKLTSLTSPSVSHTCQLCAVSVEPLP